MSNPGQAGRCPGNDESAGKRRGAKRAAVAVAHTLLVMVSALLTQQQETSREPGGRWFAARGRQAVQRRLVHRLEALGELVSLQRTATPAA